ncbi:BnaC03g62740D [Brassica napus]|uniref:(rape) hypothetical protein n=1 Tax=Brassica napus TaxID=3708 RepID=A0A078HB82_BRANA|nr:unnamed protein product [Brassica napus]CDY34058.1 BnaC03g62740D [Brassica napus]
MTEFHMEVESSKAVIELQVEEAETNSSSQESLPELQVMYRCRKCRRIKRSGNYWQTGCVAIFTDTLCFLQDLHDGFVEEKLLCLGCNARLGYFNWAGMQCSCGAWVNPAFQLHKEPIKL